MLEDINTAPTPESDDRYILHIDNFEGPLDLLPQFPEKDFRHIFVVMLAGMQDEFFAAALPCSGHHGGFDKLGARPNNMENFHGCQKFYHDSFLSQISPVC